jgi:Zn-dependent protease
MRSWRSPVRPSARCSRHAVAAILAYLIVVNVMLAAFNLIPAYPMDGGRALRALLWQLRGDRDGATVTASFVGMGFALLFIVAGVAGALGTRTWPFGWYAVLGAYLMRQCWQQYRALRPRRLPAVVPAAAPAGAVIA